MDTQETGKKCCCMTTAIFVLMFLVGGILGYLMGHHCPCRMMCRMGAAPMEMGGGAPMPPAKRK